MTADVIVVGGGVVGLSAAVALAESGRGVRVWARDGGAATTSAVAGALIWPYRIEPAKRVGAWSVRSLRVYEELAARPEETGVRIVGGRMADTSLADLDGFDDWAAGIGELREVGADEMPPGYARGLYARVPLVDMAVYLEYLRRRLLAAGGSVAERSVSGFDEPAAEARTVVNCTGLGARDLVPDPLVRPVRGQLVVVENPGVDEWFVSAPPGAEELTYVLPLPGSVKLGGSAGAGRWDLAPDPAEAEAIVARCAAVRPELAGAKVVEHRVGLRPARPEVRLEAVELPGGTRLVHNYGHGGAGVTVAWGCADDVVRLAG
ncbi:FAD-dependent oxidoreductase [Streptomyces sp. NPDC050504]|uniref:FAD-dependent oxidoreductase n=1 Tax=Streptomyces sp. NPDC050504 TaxID=3365618 RepID=UPI0037AEFD6B